MVIRWRAGEYVRRFYPLLGAGWLLLPVLALLITLVSVGIVLRASGGSRMLASAPSPPAAEGPPTSVPLPAPPPLSSLELESRPAGASVTVDGKDRGPTPLVLQELEAGPHAIRLSLPGWQEWQSSLVLPPNETRLVAVALLGPPTPAPVPVPTAPPTPTPEPVYPLAVMVENSVDARPQSGLARADIVYDALVEGGISRFMAIYVDGRADNIGPVRSARHYFVYLAGEYNAAYVHIGSSPQGYEALSAIKIANLDETYGDPGFWRSRARYAPHNAYTSTDLIRSSLARMRRVGPGSLAGFHFRGNTEPVQGPEAREISITYPGGYRVKYSYSPEEQRYPRFMDGAAQRDADTGEPVAPQNVVVQVVDAWLIPRDDAGRLDMELVGQGKAVYFRDGVVTEGYWYKASLGNVTEWYDADWKPVEMSPGKTWVQVIPPSARLSY